MIKFDLLSEKEKKSSGWDGWRRFVLVAGSGLIGAAFVFVAALVAINTYLSRNLEKESARLDFYFYENLPSGIDILKIEDRLTKMNEKLALAAKMRSGVSPKAEEVAVIVELVPPGILISSLEIKEGEPGISGVQISGLAKDRQGLLLFRRTLGGESSFSELDLPYKYLLEEKDIRFELSFKITRQNAASAEVQP